MSQFRIYESWNETEEGQGPILRIIHDILLIYEFQGSIFMV